MVFALVVVFLALFGSIATADDIREKLTTVGFKAGLISPGEFWVGAGSFDADMSISFGGFLDYKLGPKISGGLLANIHNFSVADESAMMMEFGFAIKAWIFSETSNLTFTPGFGISYGNLGSTESLDGSSYMILNGMIEMTIAMESFNLLLELGIAGAPTGGNDAFEMTYGPGLIIRGGAVF